MKLAATMGTNARPPTPEFVRRLERAGFDSIWTAEDWGLDAVSQLAWVGSHTSRIRLGTSIMQMPARTPGATAMTAATLAMLSGGRFILGLGPSGPQVAEGWHGVEYGKPITRLREYVGVVRRMLAADGPVEHAGAYYHLPFRGDGASGLGKALRLNTKPRHPVPIYVAAMGPKALATGAEIADGVISTLVDADRLGDLEAALVPGLEAAGRTRDSVTVVVNVSVVAGDDVAACFDRIRPAFARTIGGYGARSKNFYVDQITRGGWGEAAAKVQDLYLAGRRDEATTGRGSRSSHPGICHFEGYRTSIRPLNHLSAGWPRTFAGAGISARFLEPWRARVIQRRYLLQGFRTSHAVLLDPKPSLWARGRGCPPSSRPP